MNNPKANKIISIVFWSIVATAIIAYAICWFVINEQTRWFTELAWEWLNKPLPVVGSAISIIAFCIIKFILPRTSFGQRNIRAIRQEVAEAKEELAEFKKTAEEAYKNLTNFYDENKSYIDNVQNDVVDICNALPNRKVKLIGGKINERNQAKEETDNQAEEE